MLSDRRALVRPLSSCGTGNVHVWRSMNFLLLFSGVLDGQELKLLCVYSYPLSLLETKAEGRRQRARERYCDDV